MELLESFVINEPVKQAVYDYFIKTLEKEIIDNALSGKDVSGYKEAKQIIDRAFNNLEGQYANKKQNNQDPR